MFWISLVLILVILLSLGGIYYINSFNKLNEGFTLILKIRDDLNLNNDEDLNNELDNIKRLDEKLTAAKNYYNKNTSLENAIIRRFPTNVIASIHNFKIKLFFDGKDMDDEIIDDFKL